MTHRYFKV